MFSLRVKLPLLSDAPEKYSWTLCHAPLTSSLVASTDVAGINNQTSG